MINPDDLAPFVKILKCGCQIHAEFPLHVEGNLTLEQCKMHANAAALRNVVRYLARVEDFWPISEETTKRLDYALELVGDKA